MISKGEKIFVVTRRLFEGDIRRHFVGEITDVSKEAVRAEGYAFVFDESKNEFIRREKKRTRIFPLTDSGIVINIISKEVLLEEIRYGVNVKNQRVITDGKSFSMNVSEFGSQL